ncbi:probable G-protein coupled receptor Mth-like 1 [Galendromus occidentalis]|uniref:Probable G-protein coupled receptor Mth-like 1 n=1 Tax=Galendromus occidentalis TaxID=34638 RepID=A0AAJ7SEY1_9ACAR|nr:probable G-protein coupled receptor Mth-like 1 [Galendromus occidentalis]
MSTTEVGKLSEFLLNAVYMGWARGSSTNASTAVEAESIERYQQRLQIESMLRHLETNRSSYEGVFAGKAFYAVNPLLYLLRDGNHSWILEFFSNDTDRTRPAEYYSNITTDSIFTRDRNELKEFFPIVVALMCTSMILLLAVILVYCATPKLRTTHGKNVITLSVCFVIVYIGLLMDLVARDLLSPSICLSLSIVHHGVFLAVFFWTNVMAYDIWQAIATLTPNGSNHPTLRKDKYPSYSMYAWSMTFIVTAFTVLLQFSDLVEDWYKPHFGEGKCWLNGYLAYVLYFNMPVGLILACNGVIFALTAWSLYTAKMMHLTNVSQCAQHRRTFHLYMKISLIMGIIWTFEFIPWLTGYHRLYVIAGLLNCLHGVFLFVIFVCKRRVREAFWRNLPFTKRRPPVAIREMSKASLQTLSMTPSICTQITIDSSVKI